MMPCLLLRFTENDCTPTTSASVCRISIRIMDNGIIFERVVLCCSLCRNVGAKHRRPKRYGERLGDDGYSLGVHDIIDIRMMMGDVTEQGQTDRCDSLGTNSEAIQSRKQKYHQRLQIKKASEDIHITSQPSAKNHDDERRAPIMQ